MGQTGQIGSKQSVLLIIHTTQVKKEEDWYWNDIVVLIGILSIH